MNELVSVAFNVPLNRVFSYRSTDIEPTIGVRVEAVFGKRSLTGFITGIGEEADIDPAKVKTITRVVDAQPLFGEESVVLARWIAGMYFCGIGEALQAILPSGKRESAAPALPFDDFSVREKPLELSDEQRIALSDILSTPGGTRYLFGNTGSGKTEVFLQAAEATLSEGRGVIYLVPEIALTHQVVEAVSNRFGSRCAVIHSRLTPSQKLSEWRRILRGEAVIVVGARSAVFAPVRALGLIVVDEEHENTYKSGSSPRYHARQVAMHRCSNAQARLVLGSATPSVEAVALMRSGRIKRLSLTKRLAGGSPPGIHIIDMRNEEGAISRALSQAIRETKDSGGQTILFLNRRGFSYFWSCFGCGAELKCKHCSVSLTYHKERGRAICHYCGYQEMPPRSCPTCKSLDVGWRGFGTEQVEEDVKRLFPDLSMARLDADSVERKGALEETLTAFRAGSIDLLLGTQMVAKGLNFPKVKLVGVILADTTLNLPDFRSPERAFSLITQVAGRAGRFSPDGRVFVQTFRPESSVIRCAAAHDIEGFYTNELAQREMLGFPPFTRLMRIVFRSKSAEKASDAARHFAEAANAACIAGVEVLGPAECPISMMAGNARRHVVLRSHDGSGARAATKAALKTLGTVSGVYLEIDPDPVSLM